MIDMNHPCPVCGNWGDPTGLGDGPCHAVAFIVNATQHPATPEQIAVGVRNVDASANLPALLTFNARPSAAEKRERANAIADVVAAKAREIGARHAMVGCALFLVSELERALAERGLNVVYAFSKRESVEVVQPDGSVRKTSVFKHDGFVEAGV